MCKGKQIIFNSQIIYVLLHKIMNYEMGATHHL